MPVLIMYVKLLNLLIDQLSISVTPTSSVVGEGATAIFTATASGINKENFVYQWKKRGNRNLPNKVLGINGAELKITNSLKSDEGQYYCTVTNEWGNSEVSNDVTLTVVGMWLKFICSLASYVLLLLLLYTTAGLPVIKEHPLTQVVNDSEKVTFECFVSGSNNLTITWERDGSQYTSGRIENKKHSDGFNSSLTLNRATMHNNGKYRCRATNVDGNYSTSNEAELISNIHAYRVMLMIALLFHSFSTNNQEP